MEISSATAALLQIFEASQQQMALLAKTLESERAALSLVEMATEAAKQANSGHAVDITV